MALEEQAELEPEFGPDLEPEPEPEPFVSASAVVETVPPVASEAPRPVTAAEASAVMESFRAVCNRGGCLLWAPGGLQAEIRPLTSAEETPSVEQLRTVLRELSAPAGLSLAVTETLGEADALVILGCAPGGQAALLTLAGQIIEALAAQGLYEEVIIIPCGEG